MRARRHPGRTDSIHQATAILVAFVPIVACATATPPVARDTQSVTVEGAPPSSVSVVAAAARSSRSTTLDDAGKVAARCTEILKNNEQKNEQAEREHDENGEHWPLRPRWPGFCVRRGRGAWATRFTHVYNGSVYNIDWELVHVDATGTLSVFGQTQRINYISVQLTPEADRDEVVIDIESEGPEENSETKDRYRWNGKEIVPIYDP